MEELEDRTVPTLLGQQLFPSDNPMNQNIANAPVASNSAAIIAHIGSSVTIHPDWGYDNPANGTNPLYGIPVNVVHGNSVTPTSFTILNYPGESDLIPVPLPTNPVIEGDFQNGPNLSGQRGDSHLIIWDEDNNIAYELYGASRPNDAQNFDGNPTGNVWSAAGEAVWNMNTDAFRTLGFTSADAAGLSILAGLVRPDEGLPTSQGGQGVINHALRFTLPNSDIDPEYVYPASHITNRTLATNNLPYGGRLRLQNTPAVNAIINAMGPEAQIIAHAMQQYGLILADGGSAMYVSGASDSVNANNQLNLVWDMNDVLGLENLTAGDFDVVSLTPVVSGVTMNSSSPGSTIVITGQGFSGSAGHLEVLFVPQVAGDNPPYTTAGTAPNQTTTLNAGVGVGTSVQIISDTELVVTVPSGLTGTVDVRVLSGQLLDDHDDNKGDAANFNGPIFGNGLSAISAGDKFTFTTGTRPAAPSSVVPTSGQNQVSLSWATVSGAASYNIYRSTTSGGEGFLPYKTGVTTTNFTDPGLSSGTTYFYEVTAVNVAGEGSRSSEVSAPAGTDFPYTFSGPAASLPAPWNTVLGGGFSINSSSQAVSSPIVQGLFKAATVNNVSLANVSVQADVALSPSPANGISAAAVIARSQDANDINNCYFAALTPAPGGLDQLLIEKTVNGQITGIAAKALPGGTTSGTLTLEVFGNTLTAYLNGQLEVTTTDSTYAAAGNVGIGAQDQGATFANFSAVSLATPAVSFTDTFKRSASATLGDPWYANGALPANNTTPPGGGFKINGSNQAVSLTAGLNVASLFGISFTTSGNVSATVVNPGSGAGVVADWNSSTRSGYELLLTGSASNPVLKLFKITNGVATQLGATEAVNAFTGTVDLQVGGGTLSAFFNGFFVFSLTDSSFTTGSVGLAANGAGSTFSAFTANGS